MKIDENSGFTPYPYIDYEDEGRIYVAITVLGLLGLVVAGFFIGWLYGYHYAKDQPPEPRPMKCMTAMMEPSYDQQIKWI